MELPIIRNSSAEQPNISVFAHYIRNTAKQQGITLAEAADKLYDLGVRGFDVGPDDKDLPELAATKLKPINFYFFPKMLGEWRSIFQNLLRTVLFLLRNRRTN